MASNKKIPDLEKDPIKIGHYILILVFSLFLGFLGGMVANQIPEISIKISSSIGLLLSFSGVVLMIVSSKHGVFTLPIPLKAWLYNCGWIALIVGLIYQAFIIWFS